MIIKMTKVEILGPKETADDVLEALKQCGTLQLDRWEADTHSLSCLADNPDILSQQIVFRDTLSSIEAVLKLLPPEKIRPAYINVEALLPSLLPLNKKHVRYLQGIRQTMLDLQESIQRHQQNIELVSALIPVLRDKTFNHHLSMVAIKLDDDTTLGHLRESLARAFDGEFELVQAPIQGNSLAIAVLLPQSHLKKLQSLLQESQIPEQHNVEPKNHQSLTHYLSAEKKQIEKLHDQLKAQEKDRLVFSAQWAPYYTCCHEWLIDRIETHHHHYQIKETEMCFAINGWLPSDEVSPLKKKLEETFSGSVTLQELQVQQKDLADAPVVLKNPPFFKPFEIFTRLLPLPRYTSLDPTPFLGLFLPIFFGMILGDAGYAIVLFLMGVSGWLLLKTHPWAQDASKVLTICSVYTAIFGIIYGEFFGEQGAHLIGLQPLVASRSGTLMPMLYFTLAVGGFHIVTGLALGVLSSFMQKEIKEGSFRALSLLLVIILGILALTFFTPSLYLLRTPLLLTVGVAIPVLIITGGFLAPLEMLKHLGHIVSYTRIMAVGMTSVMLAYVANRLAGEAGSLAVGIMVGIFLHTFNIILGIFAPAVHSLRLHYVEFFSKFFESGGKRYSPLKPSNQADSKGDVWKT